MEAPLKLLLTISVLKDGGAEHVLIMLANFFKRNGLSPELVVTNQKRADAVTKGLDPDIPLWFLEDTIQPRDRIPFAQRAVNAACRGFEAAGRRVPDVLASRAFSMYYGAHIEAMKTVLRTHEGWTVLAFLQPANQIVLKATEKSAHRVFLSERADPLRYFKTRYAPYFLKRHYPRLAGMVFQTPNAMQAYKEKISCNGRVIPNPIPASLPAPWEGEREKTIVNFCRLAKQKNLPMLFDAFERFYSTHPEYTLIIYGDGELRDELLRDAAARSCGEHIRFVAHQKDIHTAILKAGMFASSSDFEGMSNSMLEAMALGLPTVCTDCPIGGAAAVIRHYENGVLVPVGDAEAMARELTHVADDPEFAKMIGENAQQLRTAQSEAAICQAWLDFLRE